MANPAGRGPGRLDTGTAYALPVALLSSRPKFPGHCQGRAWWPVSGAGRARRSPPPAAFRAVSGRKFKLKLRTALSVAGCLEKLG